MPRRRSTGQAHQVRASWEDVVLAICAARTGKTTSTCRVRWLLSKDGAGSAAPLVAAFADRVMLEAVRAAEVSSGGRLDPPMLAVLDEAANI